MRLSLTSSQPLWMMNTSSSRTDSEILTLISPFENFLTVQGTVGTLSLYVHGVSCGVVWSVHGWGREGENWQYNEPSRCDVKRTERVAHRSATAWASSGWLFPADSQTDSSVSIGVTKNKLFD